MGCDIHAAIEWDAPGDPSFEVDGVLLPVLFRDYRFFARVAGVRGSAEPVVPPRGWRSNRIDSKSWDLLERTTIPVSKGDRAPQNGVDVRTAASYVESGGSLVLEAPGVRIDDPDTWTRITAPDYHTPTWLTVEELAQALASYGGRRVPHDYAALVGSVGFMRALEGLPGVQTWISIWFDS